MDKDNSSQKLTLDQERALKIMRSGRNIFLSGAAGTGKSYLISKFIKENRDKNVVVCAPTGVAAVNVRGTTLHRLFWIPKGVLLIGDYNTNPRHVLEKADIIIIDEISMCRIDIFEYVIRTIQNIVVRKQLSEDKSHIKKQIIVSGDFYQLPPIASGEDKEKFTYIWGLERAEDYFAFNSSLWYELEFVNIILKTPVRQNEDMEYIENLNKIRIGDVSGIKWFNTHIQREPIHDAVFICGRNDRAKEINDSKIESVDGESRTYTANVKGQVNVKEIPVEIDITLKIGMRVMLMINSHNGDYQNGSIGYVTGMEENRIDIELGDNRIVTITRFEWEVFDYETVDDRVEKVRIGCFRQFPIKPAYAITIHKSQGQTFSAVNVSPECFDKGQLYVALSRVERADQMSLARDIDEIYLRTSEVVRDFYDDLDDELLGYEFDEHKWDEDTDRVLDSSPNSVEGSYMYRIKKVRPQAYTGWTEEEDEQLQREWAEGENLSEIANIHGRTVGAIRARLTKMMLDNTDY
ncbi:ATP-dependent RecD-like DNA helicase [Butyrivibrio sp. JL13D10]|uniref:ATP-dependent DNA helicase n=1 Tax=Butyrivibrio sp. JL13D10 TaxID=3236815 RepID=UPI0038B68E40